MTECNHNGEEIDFKLKAKPCTKCGKLLDLHEWTATIRRGATLAENKRILNDLYSFFLLKWKRIQYNDVMNKINSLRLKGDDKK